MKNHIAWQLEISFWQPYIEICNFLVMERDPLTMRVARNIETLMERLGTDAAKLSRAAGLGPTSIYDILSGKSRSPRLETLTKIADALGVPVALLLEEEGDDDLKNEILALVASMPPSERQRTLITIRAWAEMAKRNSQSSIE